MIRYIEQCTVLFTKIHVRADFLLATAARLQVPWKESCNSLVLPLLHKLHVSPPHFSREVRTDTVTKVLVKLVWLSCVPT